MALAHLISTSSFQAVCCRERLKGRPAESTPIGIQIMGYPTLSLLRMPCLIAEGIYQLGQPAAALIPAGHTKAKRQSLSPSSNSFHLSVPHQFPPYVFSFECNPELGDIYHLPHLEIAQYLVDYPIKTRALANNCMTMSIDILVLTENLDDRPDKRLPCHCCCRCTRRCPPQTLR